MKLTFKPKELWIKYKSELILGSIAFALVVFPSFLYLSFFSPKNNTGSKMTRMDSSNFEVPRLFSANGNSLASLAEPACDAQTIACDAEFQKNKSLACGNFKSVVVDELLKRDESPCKGMERSYVEQQLNEACTKGCLAPSSTPSPTPGSELDPTRAPSATPKPTNTSPTVTSNPSQFSLKLNFEIILPGIGNANFENSAPKHTTIESTVTIIDATTNSTITEKKVSLSYSKTTATFNGALEYSDSPTDKEFHVKIKTPTSLAKKLTDKFLQKGQTEKTVKLPLATGDVVESNEMDVADYSILLACYKKIDSCSQESSQRSDLNDDGMVGIDDLNILQRAFSTGKGDLIGD